MTRRTLTSVGGPEVADLPPKWDGAPVAWREWVQMTNTFVCRRSGPGSRSGPKPTCECGDYGHTLQGCSGLIDGLVALTALRCAGCGADTVVEVGAGELHEAPVWDLHWPEDYGPEGSRA